jgi:hypothetical protein
MAARSNSTNVAVERDLRRVPVATLDFRQHDIIVNDAGQPAARITKVMLTEIVTRGGKKPTPRRFRVQFEAEVIRGMGTMLPTVGDE